MSLNPQLPLSLIFRCVECGSILPNGADRECPDHPTSGILTSRNEHESYVLTINGTERMYFLSERAASLEAEYRRRCGQLVEVALRRTSEIVIEKVE